jgi:hypothetical protein
MIPMDTYWHVCTPEAHRVNCTETLTLTTTRPKTTPGMLLVEFHPPYGKDQDVGSQVSAQEAERWPHIINYS